VFYQILYVFDVKGEKKKGGGHLREKKAGRGGMGAVLQRRKMESKKTGGEKRKKGTSTFFEAVSPLEGGKGGEREPLPRSGEGEKSTPAEHHRRGRGMIFLFQSSPKGKRSKRGKGFSTINKKKKKALFFLITKGKETLLCIECWREEREERPPSLLRGREGRKELHK